MEYSWDSEDEQAIYESTLEQVVSYRGRNGSVVDYNSINEIDYKHL